MTGREEQLLINKLMQCVKATIANEAYEQSIELGGKEYYLFSHNEVMVFRRADMAKWPTHDKSPENK